MQVGAAHDPMATRRGMLQMMNAGGWKRVNVVG
jgi:hypothetical protein